MRIIQQVVRIIGENKSSPSGLVTAAVQFEILDSRPRAMDRPAGLGLRATSTLTTPRNSGMMDCKSLNRHDNPQKLANSIITLAAIQINNQSPPSSRGLLL